MAPVNDDVTADNLSQHVINLLINIANVIFRWLWKNLDLDFNVSF